MKLKKRILTTVLSLGIAASIGVPAAGITMAQDDTAQSDTQEKNEIVFTADGGNEILSIGQKQEEKPVDEKPVVPDRPYHEDDHDGDLILSSSYVTLDRDYAQTVKVKVKNNTNKNVNYYLEADNGNEDIYLNFVQLGSKDAPLTISPNSEQEVELSIFLQNALKESYSIPVKAYTRDGSSGDDYQETSLYTVDFLCDHGDVSFSLLAGELNEETLSQTYTVVNNGDEITDLTISVPDEVSRYISISPLIENYTISSGETISFDVKPDLFNMEEDGKDTITGELIAASGANKQTASVTFKKPENFQTIEAWRLALYQDDNPYYLIDEEPVIENKVYESVTAIDDNTVTKEEVAEALGINPETGMINVLSDNIIYNYTDENDSNQQIIFETEISTKANTDKSKTGTTYHSYKEERGNIVFENSIYLSGEEAKKYVTDYLDAGRDLFNMKKAAGEMLNNLYKDINGISMDDITLTFTTKAIDTAWSALGKAKSTKHVIKTIDKLNKINNEAIDAAKFIDYISILSNPNYSDEYKKDAASKAIFTALGNVLGKAADSIPGVGSFYSYSWDIGLNYIKRLVDINNHPKSSEEFGLYNLEEVKGGQCTNAGEITNYPNSKVGNGTKNNRLREGTEGFFDTYELYNSLPYLNEREILQIGEEISKKYYSSKTVRVSKAGEDRVSEADANITADNKEPDDTNKNTSLVFITGRIYPNGNNGNYLGHYDMDGNYVGQKETEQEIIVNGTSFGTVKSDVMNDMFIIGILGNEYNINDINTVTRRFNTDPGHYWIDTDTEYNTFIPNTTLIAYTGSLDDIEDIRALPDFAVYPENIYSGDDNYIGDRNPVTVKVYNRGPRGGWADVEVKIDGNTVYSEENKYIGGFSGEEITFDFTPTSEKHTVSVILNNKTVDTEERTEENNTVEAKDIYFKSYEVPEIGEITPETIRLADTDEGAFVKASIAKDATVKKIIFKLDGEVVSEEAYTPGIGEASAYIPKDKLTVGEHKLTVELGYKENATTDNTISEEKLINVKIKESINFAVKADEDSYINYRVYRKNKYDDRQYYSSVYIVDSSDSKYNAQEKQYEYKLYPDDYAEVTEDYDVIFVYNNGIELIPLKELNGSTLSMDEAKKVTVEYTDDFNNIYIAEPLKINGYDFNHYFDAWDNYRDNFLVGDGIDSLDVKVNYNISGGRDSVTETLDITKGDAVIKLVDNTKTFTFTNYSGNIQNREIVAEKDNDYYVIDCLFEAIDDNKMTAVLTNEANKTFQNADKAIFYFMDDAAIYEIDLKTFTENEIDLESIRNNYNKVSYVYEGSNTEILSRTIQRKKENSGSGTGTHEFKTDSILAATGEYIVKTKYKSNGIVLDDAQEIIVSGTDVEIVLPEAGEDLTTISVNYPDYYTNVRLSYYDDNWNWLNETISTSGDKIVVPPGTRTFNIYAHTHDGIDIGLRRDIDVVEKTNTEFNINDNYAANVNISNIESDTNIFNTTKGSSVGFELSSFKDEYGSVLANYYDDSYDWNDNYTDAKLILTNVNDSSKQYEIDYGSSVNYIYNNKTLTFTLPEEIEGDYNYKIMMTRVVPDPPIPLEEIKLDKNELTMEPDSEEELTIAYIPDDTTWSKDVWWESSDEDIVRVEDGKIKALQEGTATVTVYSNESYSISDSCEVTVKHIHDMQTVLAKDPTCTEDGNILYYICSKCDKWYEDADGEKEITDKASVVLQAFGHDYEQKVTKEASCEEAGVITFTCKNDPTHTYTEEIAALGHEWGEWEITKEAKEGTEGERTRICKTDSTHTETQIIPALPHVHTIEAVSEVPASCETDGSRAHFICTTDGLLFEDSEGLTEIKDETELVIPALGHDWNEWTVSKEASCTEKGLEIRICKHDETHAEEREIEAKGHSFIKTERKEATCEVPGNTEYYTCTECGLIYADAEGTQEITLAQTIIEPLGHDWSDWSVTKEASCSEAGEETRTCAHDGEEQTRYIEPLGHEWSEWQIVRAATQTELGERIRICAHDESHVDREIIPMIVGQDDPADATDTPDTIATQEEQPKQQDNTKDNEQNEEMENTSSGENRKPEDNNKNVIESNSQAESDKPRAVSAKPESDATGAIAVTADNAETAEGSVKAVDTGDRGVALWIVLIASATFALGVTFFVGKHRKDNG